MPSRMLANRKKQAVDWTGPLDKIHYREDRVQMKDAQKTIVQGIDQILKNIKVKGSNLYEWVHQLGGLGGVAQSTDTEIKRGYYGFRNALKNLLEGVDPASLQKFYAEYGQNPLDWRFIDTSKRSSSKRAWEDDMKPIPEMPGEWGGRAVGEEKSKENDEATKESDLSVEASEDEDFLGALRASRVSHSRNFNHKVTPEKRGNMSRLFAKRASIRQAAVDVDVEIGRMRGHFESELAGDDRDADTDHVGDKYTKEYPKKQEVFQTERQQQNKLEEPKKVSKLLNKVADDFTEPHPTKPIGDNANSGGGSLPSPEGLPTQPVPADAGDVTPEDNGGGVDEWAQKVLDHTQESHNQEILDSLLEACSAVGVPEELTDTVVEKVLQDSGIDINDLESDIKEESNEPDINDANKEEDLALEENVNREHDIQQDGKEASMEVTAEVPKDVPVDTPPGGGLNLAPDASEPAPMSSEAPKTLEDAKAQGYQWATQGYDDGSDQEYWEVYKEKPEGDFLDGMESIDDAIGIEHLVGGEAGPAPIRIGGGEAKEGCSDTFAAYAGGSGTFESFDVEL